MQKWALQDGAEWSLTHAFYANLGGCVVRFPPSPMSRNNKGEFQQETTPNADIEANRRLSSSIPPKESTLDQPIKPSRITEMTVNNDEWRALPPKQQKGKHWCPFRPAHCPCQNKEKSSIFENVIFDNIRANSYAFKNGRFRANLLYIKFLPSDVDTSPISQAPGDYANRDLTTSRDFIALCEKVDRYVVWSWVCIY
jgi:hypothetical protein